MAIIHKQLSEIWEKQFGNDYTDRKLEVHRTEGDLRKKSWSRIFEMVDDVDSVIEVGCNVGMNLEGIFHANNSLHITGIEPNKYALKKALKYAQGRYEVLGGNIFNLSLKHNADMVITCTLLIHISPDQLLSAMNEIYMASNKYILIMEYYWPIVKEVNYRGLKEALWKQDYGAKFYNNFDVHLIETGYLDSRDGFDRTTWWLFKK
tara:strand:- start:666 stop:1283 length:618 start_codon:yes stop_codon:yes gene_type:complete